MEAGASQASQQMGGLKTAYMTRTPAVAIYYGQMIGSFFGILMATLVYRIYTGLQRIPSNELSIPDAHLWLVAARLIYQQGLPPRALTFALWAFLFGATFSVIRIIGSNRWWRAYVPSGIAMAIGKAFCIRRRQKAPLANAARYVHRPRDHTATRSRQSYLCCRTQTIWNKDLHPLVFCHRVHTRPGYFQHRGPHLRCITCTTYVRVAYHQRQLHGFSTAHCIVTNPATNLPEVYG